MTTRKRRGAAPQNTKILLRIAVVAVLLALLFILFAPGRGYFHYRKLNNQLEDLALEKERLQQENTQLTKEIERLKTDEKYLEKLAREKYGLLRKNESVYEFKGSVRKQ